MYKILNNDRPEDFVIAIGKAISLEEFIKIPFIYFDLDYKKYIDFDNTLLRPLELSYIKGNPFNAEEKLGWKATYYVEYIIEFMIKN